MDGQEAFCRVLDCFRLISTDGLDEEDQRSGPNRLFALAGLAIGAVCSSTELNQCKALIDRAFESIAFQGQSEQGQASRLQMRRLSRRVAPTALGMGLGGERFEIGMDFVHDEIPTTAKASITLFLGV